MWMFENSRLFWLFWELVMIVLWMLNDFGLMMKRIDLIWGCVW